MLDAFRMLARYNRIANERLYDTCAQLDEDEYRRERQGSFGSVHGLLNHVLLGDRIWMSRFSGGGRTTPPLNTVLFEEFDELRASRALQDAEIESFFEQADGSFLIKPLSYANSMERNALRKCRLLFCISSTIRHIIAGRYMS